MKIEALFKMPVINNCVKEIHFKILYCGPKNSGKRSSLSYIGAHSDSKRVFSVNLGEAKENRIRFLIVNTGIVLGFKVFFHVLTTLNDTIEENHQFLSDVDGLVFVADSSPPAEKKNKKSLQLLHEGLEQHSKDIFRIPLALQYNKRDLNPKIPLKRLRTGLNKYNSRDFESSLIGNFGFMEPFKHVCKGALMVLKSGEIQ